MKKTLLFSLAVILMVSMAACKNNTQQTNATATNSPTISPTSTNISTNPTTNSPTSSPSITQTIRPSQSGKSPTATITPSPTTHKPTQTSTMKPTPTLSPKPTPSALLNGKLEDIIKKLYSSIQFKNDYDKEWFSTGLLFTKIDTSNCEYMLGKSGLKFKEGLASEPMISTSAYSLCIVRANSEADVDQLKKEIREHVNPRKWICVGVDERNVIVDSIGDVVFLVMSDAYAQELHQAFLALK